MGRPVEQATERPRVRRPSDDDPLPRAQGAAPGQLGSRSGGLTARWARPHEGGVKREGCGERGRTGSAGAP